MAVPQYVPPRGDREDEDEAAEPYPDPLRVGQACLRGHPLGEQDGGRGPGRGQPAGQGDRGPPEALGQAPGRGEGDAPRLPGCQGDDLLRAERPGAGAPWPVGQAGGAVQVEGPAAGAPPRPTATYMRIPTRDTSMTVYLVPVRVLALCWTQMTP